MLVKNLLLGQDGWAGSASPHWTGPGLCVYIIKTLNMCEVLVGSLPVLFMFPPVQLK